MRLVIVLLIIVYCLLSTVYRPAAAQTQYFVFAPLVIHDGPRVSGVSCGGVGELECGEMGE